MVGLAAEPIFVFGVLLSSGDAIGRVGYVTPPVFASIASVAGDPGDESNSDEEVPSSSYLSLVLAEKSTRFLGLGVSDPAFAIFDAVMGRCVPAAILTGSFENKGCRLRRIDFKFPNVGMLLLNLGLNSVWGVRGGASDLEEGERFRPGILVVYAALALDGCGDGGLFGVAGKDALRGATLGPGLFSCLASVDNGRREETSSVAVFFRRLEMLTFMLFGVEGAGLNVGVAGVFSTSSRQALELVLFKDFRSG